MPQCQARHSATTSCIWRQTRTAPQTVKLVYNVCYALRKTLGVKSHSLVGAHSAGQQAPANSVELCHLWVDWWASERCSLAGRRKKGLMCCGERLHFHGDLCQNPVRGLDTAQASWDGDAPGGDLEANSSNGTCDQARVLLLMGSLQGPGSGPSERLCFLKGCSWAAPCCLAGSREVEHWFDFYSPCEVMFGWFQFVLSLGLIWKKKTPCACNWKVEANSWSQLLLYMPEAVMIKGTAL